jgi:broad specificity phosphatase PhoE
MLSYQQWFFPDLVATVCFVCLATSIFQDVTSGESCLTSSRLKIAQIAWIPNMQDDEIMTDVVVNHKETKNNHGSSCSCPFATISSSSWTGWAFLGVTVVAGAAAFGAATAATLLILARRTSSTPTKSTTGATLRRQRLPDVILLVRHGESEGNADHTLYREKPDNLVRLTATGLEQARTAGVRIESILQTYDEKRRQQQHQQQQLSSSSSIWSSTFFFWFRRLAVTAAVPPLPPPPMRVHLIVSPFERTVQTAMAMRQWFDHRIVRTDLQPRIREQEFGNLQKNDDFVQFRAEQKKVGRFWYRFPTGESGADVHDRVKSWWSDSVLNVNEREGHDRVDALVIVTHGLTMRFVLMGLYDWSPNTFHSVWNAGNCDVYVLNKDLTVPGMSPYILDHENGDVPRSSIHVLVEYCKARTTQEETTTTTTLTEQFTLSDYLSIPAPRTTQSHIVKAMLKEQHEVLREADITHFSFIPFHEGAVIPGWNPDLVVRPSSEKHAEEVLKFPSYIHTTRPPLSTSVSAASSTSS